MLVGLLLVTVGPALGDEDRPDRVLVMNLEADRGVDPELAVALQDRVLWQARRQGLDVSGENEIVRLLDVEAKQELLGCASEDAACLSNAALQAAKADWIVLGRLTRIGHDFDLTLRLIDVTSGRVTRQVEESVAPNETDLAAAMGPTVALLLTEPLYEPLPSALARRPRPLLRNPWFWAGTVATGGAGVAAAVFLGRPARGTLGRFELDTP